MPPWSACRPAASAGVRGFVVHRTAAHAVAFAVEIAALGLPGVELAEPGRGHEA